MTIVQNKAATYDEMQLIANYFLSQSIVASFYKINLPKMDLFLNETHVWYSYSFTWSIKVFFYILFI